ncbi:CO dehydrogenase maturation factor [Thermodesulfitimonas autotrophica]|uniref:CO dehydrogenase maturation factor n=1 Tax=Thermodesulfitimonas autotrophica TaxID=1894989 RepID=A0A3N5AP49_9THEO|nr:AAA family ATPase [Thermodesulfitimonas autotrophica]RPF46587.1 CO dehydrogenase maturation factor [Thermodesulfitimonas autotrophica]
MFIAVAGKGGTGKTTFVALVIKHLLKAGKRPILAVDADANANLSQALGIEAPDSIADIMRAVSEDRESIPAGMTKDRYVAYRIHQSLAEGKDVDVLVMGGPEGPGCYCYVNNLLRGFLKDLAANYRYVVMDNEAGLEHLSRRTTQNVDVLFILSDATVRGVRSAGRIRELADSLKLGVKKKYLVINRGQPADINVLWPEIEATGLEYAGLIPADPAVTEYDLHSRPLVSLPDDSPAVVAVGEILSQTKIL